MHPTPGTATEADLLDPDNAGCELIDGILVEKAVSFESSALSVYLGSILNAHVRPRNLGLIAGEQGTTRLAPGRLRAADVAFFSWDRIPGRRRPAAPIPALAPDLAVEVLSPSNTAREMALKRLDYFGGGTRLVWEIDPVARTAAVYAGPENPLLLDAAGVLDGGDVLPGFALPLADLFAELDRHG